MPSESPRIRARAWLQERTPLAELEALLRKKTVPLHAHYLWYFLGSMILLALTVQIFTGILLLTYYQPSVSESAAVPGAYESVREMVTKLPHGWWIRSLHHWSAHLMIAAVLLHLLSVLLLKAYRRPREVIWWTGMALFGLTLAAGFTGYLLPWNTLSFAATRVGGGIAAATPVAGSFIRELLLGGPDVSGLTLTRFFGLHVVVVPLLILTAVGLHLVLIMYHGSSVPPSMQSETASSQLLPAVRFWPDFSLRDLRLAVLALGVLMVVAFLLPPPLGTRADPMAPTPEHIRPEWYFFPVFKMLKLLPDRVLGVENLQVGILVMAVVGLTLLALPLLDTGAVETSTSRRRAAVRRRILLLAGAILGWAAVIAPLRLLLADHWPDQWLRWQDTGVRWAPAAAGIVWLAVALWFERRAARHAGAPATLFGWVLVSTIAGYTLWEGVGPRITLLALAGLWLALLVIQWPKSSAKGARVWLCKLASMVLVLGALYGTVVLGGGHQEIPAENSTVAVVSAGDHGVPRERRSETVGLLVGGLCACLFLLVMLELRIRLQRETREMGLTT
jgi:quinol-cytochrome oxidoreductase complex cytochrome b subunit